MMLFFKTCSENLVQKAKKTAGLGISKSNSSKTLYQFGTGPVPCFPADVEFSRGVRRVWGAQNA